MKQKLKMAETHYSANGTIYKGDYVLTTDPVWMTKEVVKITDLAGRIFKVKRNILTNSR